MSRVGKLAVKIPNTVSVKCEGLDIAITGPNGSLAKTFRGNIKILIENNEILVRALDDDKSSKAMTGTARSIIFSMVEGVSKGFSKEIEVNGVGYKTSVKDNYLNLLLGKSHGTKIQIPSGISVDASKNNVLVVKSHNKELLGQFIAGLIKQRPPEPYKGKGLKIKGQYVQRKEGKKG